MIAASPCRGGFLLYWLSIYCIDEIGGYMAKKGLIYALLSALLLSTMNLFVKMLGSNIPSGEIAFFRGLFGTVAVLIVMYIRASAFPRRTEACLLCEVSMAVLAWCVTL